MNRRFVLPLLLLTITVLSALQAQRTNRAAAAFEIASPTRPSASVHTPALSVRRIPEFLQSPTAERRLREELVAPVAALPSGTCFTVAEHGRDLGGGLRHGCLLPGCCGGVTWTLCN